MEFYRYIVPKEDIQVEGGWCKPGQPARIYYQVAGALVAQGRARWARADEIPKPKVKAKQVGAEAAKGPEAEPGNEAAAGDGSAGDEDDGPMSPEDLPGGGPMSVEEFAQLAADEFEEARDYARKLGVTARGRDELVERYEARINAWLAGDDQ